VKPYRLSHKARRDLDDIWDYSCGMWGARRGAAYLHDIRIAMKLVAEHPDIGPEIEDLAPYRQRPVGSHVILYRLQDDLVVVVRVLHQNMDVKQALPQH
jgi:toxin ParE1/3/4